MKVSLALKRSCMLFCLLLVACAPAQHKPPTSVVATATVPPTLASIWLTTPDLVAHLMRQPRVSFQSGILAGVPTITVDATNRYQQMAGIGASLTQTATSLIARSPERDLLMQQLFDPRLGIGISFLRQPWGSSDFSDIMFYSYEDTPGQFGLGHDLIYSVPLLLQARALAPGLVLMGTPWSPPGWMKDSGSMLSGTLRPDAYSAYAAYLVQALQAYQINGLPFAYMSVQNEPGIIEGYPGSDWSGPEEARFITEYLMPALAAAKLSPTILGYDRACCLPAFLQALAGAGVESAYHCYGPVPPPAEIVGSLFETECATSFTSYSSTPDHPLSAAQLFIDWAQAGSKTLTLWNIAADQHLGPQPRGSRVCPCLPLLTVWTDDSGQPTGQVTYSPDYYVLGHLAKFVQPGAYRIGANQAAGVESLAFQNPDGSLVLFLYNPGQTASMTQIAWQQQSAQVTIPVQAVVTMTWQP